MEINDVIQVIKPESDSQYRLCPCKCKSDNVAYMHYNTKGGDAWRVTCFDCGYTVDKGSRVRHDAQVDWNQELRL